MGRSGASRGLRGPIGWSEGAAAAADSWLFRFIRFCLSSRTCSSVTIPAAPSPDMRPRCYTAVVRSRSARVAGAWQKPRNHRHDRHKAVDRLDVEKGAGVATSVRPGGVTSDPPGRKPDPSYWELLKILPEPPRRSNL